MALFSDDFENESIAAGWTQVPAAVGSLTEERGYLKLAASGSIWNSFTPCWMYQAGISGDFDVVTRILLDADAYIAGYKNCGLVAQVDSSNACFIYMQSNGSQDHYFYRQDNVGGYSGGGTAVQSRKLFVWVRLKRVGSTFTAYYSLNSSSWTALADPASPLSSSADVNLGIFGANPAFNARFTEFTKYSEFSFPTESLTEDTFGDASLDEVWFTEGTLGGGITEADGVLSIVTSPYLVYTTTYRPYGAYQFVDGDFDISVKLDHGGDINANYEQAGIMAELDEENFVRAVLECNEGLKAIGYHKIANTAYTDSDSYIGGVAYLRIKRSGSDFNLYYSTDGSEWTELSPATKLTTDARLKILLFANHNGGTQYTAQFDNFQIISAGWTGKICGVTNPSKICGVSVANISKVCGV